MSKVELLEQQLAQVEISVKTAAKFKRGSLDGTVAKNGVTFYRDKWSVTLICGAKNTCFAIEIKYGDEGILNKRLSNDTNGGPECNDALVRKVVTTIAKAIDTSNEVYKDMAPDDLWAAVFDERSRSRFYIHEGLLNHFAKAINRLGISEL